MKFKKIVYFAALILLAVSCKTKQQIANNPEKLKKPAEVVLQKILNNQPNFNTANVSKMNLTLDLNGRLMSVSASCRMITDSALHISIQPALGIELFKVEMNRDSIHVFDKFNKKSYSFDYAFFARKFGVVIDYKSIESLISNRFFIAGGLAPENEKMESEIADNKNVLRYKGQDMQQVFYCNENDRIEKVNMASRKSAYTLDASYSSFALLGGVNFPQKITINATDKRKGMNCDFTINKVVFNETVQLTEISRQRFVKTDIEQLLKK